jgi:hypothetical protein
VQAVKRICLALLLTSLASVISAQELTMNDPHSREEASVKLSAPDMDAASERALEGASREGKTSRPSSSNWAESICLLVNTAAQANGLPVEFFARLIWQESKFRSDVVGPRTRSGARAQGIAQFMPRTARERRLLDPFDPVQAVPKSAEFLRELRDQFGNLGLAAAAYNAGPQRVRDWMAGKQAIPAQTRNYVSAITGRSIDKWLPARKAEPAHNRSDRQASDCPQLIALLAKGSPRLLRVDLGYVKESQPTNQLATTQQPSELVSVQPPSQLVSIHESSQDVELRMANPHWGMQLTAGFSESEAWALYRSIQKRYAEFIGDREPIVVARRNISFGNAMRYNIRIADEDRASLEQLCAKLISAGGACLVLRND